MDQLRWKISSERIASSKLQRSIENFEDWASVLQKDFQSLNQHLESHLPDKESQKLRWRIVDNQREMLGNLANALTLTAKILEELEEKNDQQNIHTVKLKAVARILDGVIPMLRF